MTVKVMSSDGRNGCFFQEISLSLLAEFLELDKIDPCRMNRRAMPVAIQDPGIQHDQPGQIFRVGKQLQILLLSAPREPLLLTRDPSRTGLRDTARSKLDLGNAVEFKERVVEYRQTDCTGESQKNPIPQIVIRSLVHYRDFS